MTARDIINHTLVTNKRLKGFEDVSDFGVDVLVEVITKYAREKCLEAIKNTRYAAIDIVCQEEIIDEVHAIQNIRNEDVLPKL